MKGTKCRHLIALLQHATQTYLQGDATRLGDVNPALSKYEDRQVVQLTCNTKSKSSLVQPVSSTV